METNEINIDTSYQAINDLNLVDIESTVSEYFVAYFDILGYKNLIETDKFLLKKIIGCYNDTVIGLKDRNNFYKRQSENYGYDHHEISLNVFSDNFVISQAC